MKSTGIIRRMDDLGRVVIPKEIRRQMRIREGEPLEIFTYDGAICFKKHNPMGETNVEKLGYMLKAILPKGKIAIYDSNLRKLWGSDKFIDDGSVLETEFLESIKVDGNTIGYLAFDYDDFDRSTLIRIASAYMEND